MKIRYACIDCGRRYESETVLYRCPRCDAPGTRGGFPQGTLSVDAGFPQDTQTGRPVDPLAFLPLPVRWQVDFPAGNTPLQRPGRLCRRLGFPNLYFKLDTLNPSGSLKDRASLLVAEQARELGETRVALASTGNAGASMACAGAACGISVVLFVPARAPRAKLLQSLLYGARVVPVDGTYDEAFALSIEYTRKEGGINRNTAYNPLTIEGKKTVSIEIWNQLGCRAPDVVYVPTGDGVIFAGVYKGFADLVKTGLAARMPLLVAAQAEGSNAIARSFREGRPVVLPETSTIADSLSVACPANGDMALRILAGGAGRTVEVSDAETSAAQAELAGQAGAFVEPSAAVAWAGFLKDSARLDRESTVVVLLTGTGFKDAAAAERLVSMPAPCPPDLASAMRLLDREYGERG